MNQTVSHSTTYRITIRLSDPIIDAVLDERRRDGLITKILAITAFVVIMIILLTVILFTLATPSQAAPAGQAIVAVADCRESVVLWFAPTYTGAMSNTYASVIMEAEQHGETYAVEVLYQYATTLANGRAVYRAIGWQPFSLNAERVTIVSGEIAEWGGAPLQDLLTGKEFVMGCWQVHMPLVVR